MEKDEDYQKIVLALENALLGVMGKYVGQPNTPETQEAVKKELALESTTVSLAIYCDEMDEYFFEENDLFDRLLDNGSPIPTHAYGTKPWECPDDEAESIAETVIEYVTDNIEEACVHDDYFSSCVTPEERAELVAFLKQWVSKTAHVVFPDYSQKFSLHEPFLHYCRENGLNPADYPITLETNHDPN
jgi:hypothetical protein